MTSGALNPIDFPAAHDVIVVGGVLSPGICVVEQVKRAHEFDVKKGKGYYGATVTFVGRPPAKFKVTFKLWKPEHFLAWETFRELLKYDPTKQAPEAVDVFHPVLADIDLHSVVTESIGSIVHKGGQLYEIEVEFLEYFAPPKKSAVGTPTKSQWVDSKTKTPGTQPGSSSQTLDQQNADLLKKAQGLFS